MTRRLATLADIKQARKMRQAGATVDEICKATGFGSAWVIRKTATALANPDLQLRARNLLKRGFDVPPSKQAEFDTLRRHHYKTHEIKKILRLE